MSYGAIVTGLDVANALEAIVRKWLPSYLAEVGKQAGRTVDSLPMLRSFRSTTNDLDHWPEQQIPAGVIVVGGMTDTITHGDGKIDATFPVGLGVICMARDQDAANELVQLYTGALVASVMQHGSIEGFASGIEWVDVRYDELDTSNRRTMAAGAVNIRISVDSVLDSAAGFASVPLNPDHLHADGIVETAQTVVRGTA